MLNATVLTCSVWLEHFVSQEGIPDCGMILPLTGASSWRDKEACHCTCVSGPEKQVEIFFLVPAHLLMVQWKESAA